MQQRHSHLWLMIYNTFRAGLNVLDTINEKDQRKEWEKTAGMIRCSSWLRKNRDDE